MSNSAVGFHSHFAFKIITSEEQKAKIKSSYSQILSSVGTMLFRASSIAQTKYVTQ